jgi:ribosomal protein S18 acetylase RimI-like enzyme
MTDVPRVRRAEPADAERLVAFNCAMALETESKALDEATVRAGVRGLLERPEAGFYLVAECGDGVAGSLMVTPEWSDWRGGWFWWVQSVYVDPAHRRRGVYRALYDHVRAQARAAPDVRGLRLYVERGNEGARAAYGRLGMAETSYRLYEEML